MIIPSKIRSAREISIPNLNSWRLCACGYVYVWLFIGSQRDRPQRSDRRLDEPTDDLPATRVATTLVSYYIIKNLSLPSSVIGVMMV